MIKNTYDKLYNQKVVVGLVDDVNLVFSVSLNKEIEEIFYTILSLLTIYIQVHVVLTQVTNPERPNRSHKKDYKHGGT